MKTIYIECQMGVAGDMLMAALFELIDDKEKFLEQINNLGLHKLKVESAASIKCGITGTSIKVTIDGHHENEAHHHDHHHHTNLKDIQTIISQLPLSEKIKKDAIAIYNLIAEAESKAHNTTVDQIHFHEVGNLDAIADIVGVCILIDALLPEQIIVSQVNVGSGFVKCAHGLLPVPAPATAHILQGIPICSKIAQSELTTPTGAALIKYFANGFGQMPPLKIEKIGYGMGTKDFDAPNCVRVFLGQTTDEMGTDTIAELRCNLDDMTGEAIGYACEVLFENGARDVFTTSIGMKKSRPAILLSCLCDKDKADFFAQLMLKHTTTFGVRKTICDRYVLKRKFVKEAGVDVKVGQGYGIKKTKVEYEDIVKIAKEKGITFEQACTLLHAQ